MVGGLGGAASIGESLHPQDPDEPSAQSADGESGWPYSNALSLQRKVWKWLTASTFRDHNGATWECKKDPLTAIVKAMKKAVKQHRLREIATMHPDPVPEAGDTGNGRSVFRIANT